LGPIQRSGVDFGVARFIASIFPVFSRSGSCPSFGTSSNIARTNWPGLFLCADVIGAGSKSSGPQRVEIRLPREGDRQSLHARSIGLEFIARRCRAVVETPIEKDHDASWMGRTLAEMDRRNR
ncbi:hypothetical protein, partial [Rhodopirellula bahusiensis]